MGYSADTFTAGEQPTTAKWNKLWSNDASFNDGTGIASGAITPEKLLTGAGTSWTPQSYTPTWAASTTPPSLGNGTLAASYIQVGKHIFFKIKLTFGSTSSAGSGSYTFTLPVTASSSYGQGDPIGTYIGEDTGVASNIGITNINSTTTVRAFAIVAGSKDATPLASNFPYSWGTGDIVRLEGHYDAA